MKTWERLGRTKTILCQAKRTETWEQYIITSLLVQSMPAPTAQMPSGQKSHHLQKQERNGHPQRNVWNDNRHTIFGL